ncbi:hypothetical protein NBRC10512_002136 [Rhodotorula toruloides]|uniref:RHTO0S18e00892g1_1 n=2 Tax=Rhodotorula toruloides TaxID=5286 RepID=A0A061BN35_RHOTO|nr:regulatory protein cys-3, transcription factor [Rhodotorula toruloides NP11]EMS21402.1 regulatory protein cys-3, transcription factor [Rhodotorula toruloides NP11]CDR48476.1 RHTO0S18e00892g1_1 [Rhodotorula toruloides]
MSAGSSASSAAARANPGLPASSLNESEAASLLRSDSGASRLSRPPNAPRADIAHAATPPAQTAAALADQTLPQLGGDAAHPIARLRQLALLQSLVARQTAALGGSVAPVSPGRKHGGPLPHPHPLDGSLYPSLSSLDQQPSPAHPLLPLQGVDATMSGFGPIPQPNIFGLNELRRDSLGDSSITADELAAAQASLDLWTSTVFNSASPLGSPLGTPSAYPFDQTSAALGALGGLPSSSSASPYLDWSALYPQGSQPSPPSSAAFSLPPISTLVPQVNHLPLASPHDRPSLDRSLSSFTGSLSIDSPSTRAVPFLPPVENSAPASRSSSPTQRSQLSSSQGATPTRRSSRANAGARGRAALAEAADLGEEGGRETRAGSLSGSEEGSLRRGSTGPSKPKELMTPEEIEDDKRRRNTEASARFRAKKKLRDAELQQTSAQLRERLATLEKEKDSLTNENRWLRDIVAEKAEVNPRVLDALRYQASGGSAAFR